MSYLRSSYKSTSSSYRTSSGNDGTTSSRLSRLSSTQDEGDNSYSMSYTNRRSYNYEDSSGPSSSYGDELTSRSPRQSLRLSSRYTTDDNDLDSTSTSRFSSKYKSYLSSGDQDEYSSNRSYARYSSRDESDSISGGGGGRTSLYSTTELTDDDLGYSTNIRRKTRLSYLDDDDKLDSSMSMLTTTRRLTSDSYKDSFDDSYKVTTPTDEIGDKPMSLSYLTPDLSEDYSSSRKRLSESSSSRAFSRFDSKEPKDAGQVYEAILDYKPPRSADDEICLKEGQEVIVIDKEKPHKWKVRTRRTKDFPKSEEGYAPSAYLKAKNETVDFDAGPSADAKESNRETKDEPQVSFKDLKKKKDMIVRELIETEEDLIRDMQFVQRTYLRQSESSITPKEIKAVKDKIFGCFKTILAFHNDVLLKNFQTLSKEPTKIGTLFIKLESDFDDHIKYNANLPNALAVLEENPDVNEFFHNYGAKIRDEKSLSEHLKLPFQRLNDYQLLLKELSKHLSRMDENVEDLEKAIKVVTALSMKDKVDDYDDDDGDDVPGDKLKNVQTTTDTTNTVQTSGSSKPNTSTSAPSSQSTDKLSQMLKNVLQAKDFFEIIDNNGKVEERFIFLFKTRMFITDINKNITENQRTYNVKKIVKLPDVEVAVDKDQPKMLIFKSKDLSDKNYPIGMRCKTEQQALEWLDMITHSPVEEDKSEQNIIEEDSIFQLQGNNNNDNNNNANKQTDKPANKVDENNNKINKALAANVPPTSGVEQDVTNSDHSLSSTVESSSALSSKSSALKAKADNIEEENNTEATTVATDNLRSDSLTSLEAATEAKKSTTVDNNVVHSDKVAKSDLCITQPLKAITKHVGETATFECKVSSDKLNVQWLKDNKILSGSNYGTSKSKDTYYLELYNLTPEDAGLYTIVASNSKGVSTSSSSTLNVLKSLIDSRPTSPGGSFLPHPPKFKVKLKDTELLEGTTVRFELIVRGLPIPTITCFKDNKPLKEDDHLKVLFQSKEVFEIMIEHVKPEDAGLYKCVAINTNGRDETSGKISVSSTKNVFWGLDETPECNSPEVYDHSTRARSRSPVFKWFKDGKEFEASERFQVQFDDQEDSVALIFQHVKPGDAGIYTCVASTNSEKISCSAELNVQGIVRPLPSEMMMPQIKKELNNISICEGEAVAILEAQVVGCPKPKISWFKGSQEVEASEHCKLLYEGDENYALIIKNVKDDDAGIYRLKATNELGNAETSAELTVLKKPKITQIDDEVNVMCGEKLVLEAKYESVPEPKVVWSKDGCDLIESGRIKSVIQKDKCQLIVDKVTSEDAGLYKCSICNDLGKSTSDVGVVVNSPPKFLKRLKAVEIWEDETATFTIQCSAAVPKAEVQFYKESQLIVANERIKLKEEADGEFVLKIDNAQLDDQGKYKCVIKNKYGYEEDSAELTIKKKQATPNFKEELKDQQVVVGDENVKLAVKIDGEPKPDCKWFHDGKAITEDTKGVAIVNDQAGSALIISKVTADDHGVYVCKAENVSGQSQTTGNLVVYGLPYVVKHLNNVDEPLQSDVTLTAVIKGNPKPNVEWYCNEQKIKLNDRKSLKYDETNAEYSLVILKLQNDDIGTYRIEAKNQYGQCVSTSQVKSTAKPLFTKVLSNIVCKPMESNVEMVVQLDKQCTGALVKWYKDNKEVTDKDKNYKKIHDALDNSYKLVVLTATEEMVGKYKCVASNDLGSSETAARFDILTKPKFVKGLSDMQVFEDDHVSMTVQIAGFPKPEVTFFKDGQDVSTEATIVVKKQMDDIYVLEIENIRIIMSGEYECRINNEVGEAVSKGLVTVNAKPKLVKDLTDMEVSTGEDIALEVVITGQPSPIVKWFVNDKEVKGDERVLLDARDEVFKLKIPNAVQNDTGVYHCVAENDFGKCQSADSHVKVIKHEFAPKFVKKLEDTIVVVDDNVRFEVQISASPEAEVTWYKDGVPLVASDKVLIKKVGDKHELILRNLQLSDTGAISCKAQNSKGFNTDTAMLTVHEPTLPSISGLSDKAVIEGEPLKVEAIVTGFPKPIVNWYHDGEPVDAQLVSSEPQKDKYVLNFKNLTSDLAGKYTCSAVNSAGEAIENFKIDICGQKPIFTKELEESIVMSVGKDEKLNKLYIGQSAIFETIVEGIPTPTVTWLKDDKQLYPNQRVTINNVDNEHRLEIKEITKDDVAKYTCKAENVHGEVQSVCLLKFLNEPHEPIIKKPLENVKLEEGELVTMVCKVDGEPMPAVKWFKDGQPLENSDRAQIASKADGSTILNIENAVIADSGKYEVQAENAKGTAVSTGIVQVEKPQRAPTFTKPLNEEIKVEYGCPIILQAEVFGLPAPQIQWFKDKKPILDGASLAKSKTINNAQGQECQLQIDKAQPSDSGCYSIKATNPTGEVVSSTNVKVMPKPFAPLELENLPVQVQVAKGEPIKLQAKISAYPLPKVTWLKDKKPIETSDSQLQAKIVNDPDGNISLVVDSAELNHSGLYSVNVENAVGEIAISTQVKVLPEAKETFISRELPPKMQVAHGEPLKLCVKLEGATPKKVSWLKDGQPIKTENEKIRLQDKQGEYTLDIDKPETTDEGSYALVVQTPTGNLLKTQSEVQVKVVRDQVPLTIAESLPAQVNVQKDHDLLLTMKVDGKVNIAPENVTIFKDDHQLPLNEHTKMQTTDSGEIQLLQEKCTPDDSGVYRIEVKTPEGSLANTCLVQVSDKGQPKETKGKSDKKPVFKSGLSPVNVESGQPCRLECTIEGNPDDFEVIWYKDGEEIVPNEHFGLVKEPNGTLALLVDSFSAKDAGQYSVKVKSSVGEISSAAEATLKATPTKTKPEFIDQLQNVSVDEHSPLTLKAKVVSSEPFTCKWFHNGKELTASDLVKFVVLPDGTVMLQIKDTSVNDAGTYSVQVSNKFGQVTSESKVNVQAKQIPPTEILQGLEAKTLNAGEPGFIELQVSSNTGGDIRFLKDNKQVLPTDRVHIQRLPEGIIRLAFDKVCLDDQGTFTAIFEDNNNQVQSSCPVIVKSKPIFTKPLSELTVKEGCSAKFEIEVKGNPMPELNWFKNGLELGADSRQITVIKGDNGQYFLVVDKCNLRDVAEYSVTATNEFGEESCAARLNVIGSEKFEEQPPVILQGLHDMVIKPGDTLLLAVKVKGHPNPKIVWKKDGKECPKSDNFITSFDGTNAELRITNVGLSDMGHYEVTVTNSLGSASSQSNVTAQKQTAPVFVQKLSDLEGNVQNEIELKCAVEGFPEPNITWLFNGKPIESNLKYSISEENGQHVLHISKPTEMDSGLYECRAENKLGSDRTQAQVHFIEKDKKGEAATFLTKLTDYDVLPGGVARFTACVMGNPKPELKWFKNEKEIQIDNDKYYVDYKDNGMILFEVRNVTEADLGKYRCQASNIYGYDNSIAQLNFETVVGLDRMNKTHKSQKAQNRALDADDIEFRAAGLPMPLKEMPKITKMTDNSLTLIWLPSVPEQPRFPVSYVVEFGKLKDGVWMLYQDNIKDTKCEVASLEPFEDYGFRVRVENKFGVSDPSPVAHAFRSKLKVDHEPKDFKPTDFDVPPHTKEKIAAAPKFLREEMSSMYGVCGQPVTIEFWVYGYPEPNITWFCEENQIEHSSKFNFLQDRNGKVCLFINNMDDTDVGYYTCVAKNEHGEERKTIKLMKAEPPVFTKQLEEITVQGRGHMRLDVMFKGTPEPTIKWFKDFQPLHDTSRISIMQDTFEHCSLILSDSILRDTGLYSCTATNIAGSTTTAAFVHIADAEINYEKYPFNYNKTIKPKNKPLEQFYDLGDELGRGTQGTVYHAVERSTGKSFASKMMHGVGETKQYMMSELDVMNQLGTHTNLIQLRDAFANTPHSLSLITDLGGGGSLADFIVKKNNLTENEVAHYMRQVLEGLQYMHFKNIGHFGLTIGDLLLDRINGLDVKICDFGLAHRVPPGMKHYVEFGHPEFVAPEIVNKNSVTFTADVWSAGIVVYILLLGESPFLGENDRATLTNIQNKKLDLSDQKLADISSQGKDFLRKVLNYDPSARLDAKTALQHPWLRLGNQPDGGNRLDVMDKLRTYKDHYNRWYSNASCRRYYRRRPLHSCYTHPSRMIYPPDEQYSPLVSPDRELKKYTKIISPFENVYPPNVDRDGEPFHSESHYQNGPDTYLLQLRDTDFPARIRRYLRIAATNSPSISYNLKQAHWGGNVRASMTGYVPQVSIKERRKFTDVMDEEISDEIRGVTNRTKPMRLLREIGTSSYVYGQLSSFRREVKRGHPYADDANLKAPFFREKLKDVAFKSGDDIVFSCYAVGEPEPTYTWFRNESILIESSRVEVKRTSDGRCQLRLKPAREYDIGVYKCIARNVKGSTVSRARLSLGDVPDHLHPPIIKDGSANSILLAWNAPKFVGGSWIRSYRLEYKRADENNWLVAQSNIKEEYYLVTDLQPNTCYSFRISAQNEFGWSSSSAASEVAKTLTTEENKAIALPETMQFVCTPTNATDDSKEDNLIPDIDYTRESNPVPLIKSEFKDLYDFKSLITKGKFSIIARAHIKDGTRSTLACKCVLAQSKNESNIDQEYEIMKSLTHEKIVKLAYANLDSNMFTLAMELLSGLNVLTYLSRKQYYTEDCVSKIICQVLDAIEYLHYRGIALVELQPDNVLVVDDRRLLVKLTDFANAIPISGECAKVNSLSDPEFIAPELVKNSEAYMPYSDIWTVGVLTYILLSGHSPFQGADSKETAQNVAFVRYLFDRLYPEVTQEAIRFILTVFKLTPNKRPTIEECFESRWLLPNELMIRKRQLAVFNSAHLNAYTNQFFAQKSSAHSRLLDLTGLTEGTK